MELKWAIIYLNAIKKRAGIVRKCTFSKLNNGVTNLCPYTDYLKSKRALWYNSFRVSRKMMSFDDDCPWE